MKIFPPKVLLSTFFPLFILHPSCHSLDTITPNHPMKDGDVLVSNNRGNFALGFFSMGNSTSRYVGIWYNKISEQTIVWVANRDTPLNDTSGVLSINNHGNLVLHHHRDMNLYLNPVWSTNVSTSSSNASAKLLDTGNIVLIQNNNNNNNNNVLWQSFDYPSNTMLPFMKLGLDRKTGLDRFLTSWKSPNDPGSGNLTYRIDPTGFPQLFLYKNKAPLWRVGSWTGQRWSGVPEMTPNFIFNVTYIDNADEVSVMYGVKDPTVFSRMVLEETGHVRRMTWQAHENRWFQIFYAPKEECDNFRQCGSNTNCDPYNADKFECECLPGFEPKFGREWYLRDGSGGCVRKRNVSTCRSGEGFVKVAPVKVPDTSKARVDERLSMKECRDKCLWDCSCAAYTTENESSESGCVTWHGDMEDTRKYTQVGQNLYVRVDALELAKYAKNPHGSLGKKGTVAILAVAVCLLLFLGLTFVYWFVKVRKQRIRRDRKYSFRLNLDDSPNLQEFDRTQNSDLPFFDLSSIAAATDNFSIANKLGQGGFGSVYKGLLSNGVAIAVKRLSRYSGQGIEEFKNEVVLISKLQHRNLVRILGCCIQGEEKMLIYEYLPNKSLDFFIFDESKRLQLDWKKRFDIICGVARGILYLHHDSRLRIIHRDLKASNVLLDSALNPKIADFGMARIFGGDQIEANTNRVVGTYGYMSPEYAMEGQFSIKSDVYSFGVLLLEIVTGRKNSGQHDDITSTTLVGHIWDLWKEGKAIEIVDESLGESCYDHEVQRCIQIGLLCVQDYAVDRPSMSAVVSMLGSDSTLPTPKHPAFIFKRSNYERSNPSTSEGICSVNDVSMTMIEAR
ncbi:G-type lectin S-receptor-like serine/threonine-protein kinase At1g11410 isoform X2 [Gastrolobium bilobum]|uniref:G-type lectin S-receptor-like serine/threonine-protein kinase At1g11410 isoform X2 n=1 Tax=Gastrolobium bilobum TaxID=150636 RepID=UPI002AAF180C|nr:G-type lectin S-receptor-like serine/threonine-protein kinase At1g11410 isoform X2 [Gastrolobium bilobum]